MAKAQRHHGSFLWIKSIDRADIPERSPIQQLENCWRTLAREGQLPARREIVPAELGAVTLPWIMILDVLRAHGELDYKYRLLGTANVGLLGRDPTGKLASDILGKADRATIKASFDQTVQSGKPTYWHAGLPHERDFAVSVYRAVYPLADDGVTVNKLIAAAIPEDVLL